MIIERGAKIETGRLLTHFLVETLAGCVALPLADFGVGRRQEVAAEAVAPVHQGHDRLAQSEADWLAIALGLEGVGAMVGQRLGAREAALVFRLVNGAAVRGRRDVLGGRV